MKSEEINQKQKLIAGCHMQVVLASQRLKWITIKKLRALNVYDLPNLNIVSPESGGGQGVRN
jgi:hypothetical protein